MTILVLVPISHARYKLFAHKWVLMCRWFNPVGRLFRWILHHFIKYLLVGGLEHDFFIFPYVGNVIIPTDFHSIIFQRGRVKKHQPVFGVHHGFPTVLTHSHKGLPQDIEWARDGDDGKLYIVQARPETVASQKKVGVIEEYKMLEKGRDRNHTFWDQSGSTNSDKKSGKKTLETYLYTKLSYCY